MYRIEKSDVGSWLVINSDTGETVTHYPTKVGAMNWINSQNQKTNSMSKKNLKVLEDVSFVLAMVVALFVVLCFALELLVKFIVRVAS